MILEPGIKVLVAHRRLFEGDHNRLFVGVVEGYEAGMARICGRTWIRDGYDGTFRGKEDERTKIISLASGTVIVYQLPCSVDLESFRIATESTDVIARDDKGFRMDLSEGVLHLGGN